MPIIARERLSKQALEQISDPGQRERLRLALQNSNRDKCTGPAIIRCNICAKTLYGLSSARAHLARAHELLEVKNITQHITLLEKGRRLIECEFCGLQHESLPPLLGHLRKVHKIDNPTKRMYYCPVCRLHRVDLESAAAHLSSEHGDSGSSTFVLQRIDRYMQISKAEHGKPVEFLAVVLD
jgi:hypothetical protein